ncbi:hypothetical protein ILUMI_11581 [Ignelater luminosus]|uniref:DALR anticodon binding domain-containing protein n=1 Tax=Ignelater luminosus TaxID=2038154 RepID=A0A8K0CVQ8_IGNLU|nr:hypothetical protein ILUMI_11581 [Ignelater luminosus]
MLYKEFLINLYKYLLNTEDYDNNIIRKHTRNLEKVGEFSFSSEKLSFCRNKEIEYSYSSETEIGELIVKQSKKWPLQVSKYAIINNSVHIYVDRILCYKGVIKQTLDEKQNYGSHRIDFARNINVLTDIEESNLNELSLSQLRMLLLKEVVLRLIEFNFCNNKAQNNTFIRLASNFNKTSNETYIVCGPVLSTKNGHKCDISAAEYYRKRTIDMRLMAEHKYGLRITSQVGWQEFFEKLGQAAVTIDLLQNKTNRGVTINLNDPTTANSKGASFILYNCARLATLFKEFDKRVSDNVYPALPSFENIDLSLLNQPEEWEILFLYVLQFPYIVNNCIKEIMEGRLYIHNLCNILCGMCSAFSVYYRRIRILTEPREHLFAVLHARIYLLKSVEQVLHNGLHLLNIQPVKQM